MKTAQRDCAYSRSQFKGERGRKNVVDRTLEILKNPSWETMEDEERFSK